MAAANPRRWRQWTGGDFEKPHRIASARADKALLGIEAAVSVKWLKKGTAIYCGWTWTSMGVCGVDLGRIKCVLVRFRIDIIRSYNPMNTIRLPPAVSI